MSTVNELKKRIVQAAHQAGSGHIPSAFSILDIVWTLYDEVLTSDDRFILSKGHGCLALYAVLEEKGIIPKGSLDTFARHGILGGHPDRNKISGVLASTGSLGHGLPIGAGLALAKKIKKETGMVYVLVGDGEMNEGSCWETLLIANQNNLNNLTIIVDYNRSTDRSVRLDSLADKFRAFGFTSSEIGGHDLVEIKMSLGYKIHPHAVIAITAKGNGCEQLKDPSWHHRAPNDQELIEIFKELE